MRIIQFLDRNGHRKAGIVEDGRINVLTGVSTTYDLFKNIFEQNLDIEAAIYRHVAGHYENYSDIIDNNRLLVPVDHPDPYHTFITGTGLTHLGSAASRNTMHAEMANPDQSVITDTMKMFRMGVEDGKMNGSKPASQPEWFYKGNGLTAVHPGHAIASPSFALDAGEEPEIVGIYLNNPAGLPKRIGFALANEFSDHRMEKINYLYLAHSKLRKCSFGPELLVGDLPLHIEGHSRILRDGAVIWEKPFLTGEDNMSHNIANLEYHHFKYELFRQPGDVHVHFFGTAVISFADNILTQEGDIFEIGSEVFGQPLRNSLVISKTTNQTQ